MYNYFAKKNEHAIPLFINAEFLALNVLYYKTLSELLHEVSTSSPPINMRNLFTFTFTFTLKLKPSPSSSLQSSSSF